MSTWEDDNFQFDKLFKDLNEIEQINDRMEKDIQAKVTHRISKFGRNGDKILGIDIPVAYMSPRDLPNLPSLAPEMQQNFSFTDRQHRRQEPPMNDRSMFITEPLERNDNYGPRERANYNAKRDPNQNYDILNTSVHFDQPDPQ